MRREHEEKAPNIGLGKGCLEYDFKLTQEWNYMK